MRYLCLLYVAEERLPAPGTPEFGEIVDGNLAANKDGRGRPVRDVGGRG
jgi:hypothetical protein